MKQLLGLIVLSFATALFAKETPKPSRIADLEETDAEGRVLQTFAYARHTLSEFKRKDKTVLFQLEDSSAPQIVCIKAPCPQPLPSLELSKFEGIKKSMGECGSTVYTGRSRNGKKLVLTDHSTRLCDDFRPHLWELKISESRKSMRFLRGNPKSENLKCEYANTMCIMLYMPAVCSYKDISIEGTNPCFGSAAVKQALCERGIDAEKISDDEIVCEIKNAVPICPEPMCMAPRPGCTVTSSDELNDDGCPKYPCGQMVCNP